MKQKQKNEDSNFQRNKSGIWRTSVLNIVILVFVLIKM